MNSSQGRHGRNKNQRRLKLPTLLTLHTFEVHICGIYTAIKCNYIWQEAEPLSYKVFTFFLLFFYFNCMHFSILLATLAKKNLVTSFCFASLCIQRQTELLFPGVCRSLKKSFLIYLEKLFWPQKSFVLCCDINIVIFAEKMAQIPERHMSNSAW